MDDKSIMRYETMLPENFNGTFTFTNWSDEDFVGVWGGQQYSYPKESTSPMIIHNESPIQIQHIRKKFAKDMAEREFYKSAKYKQLLAQERNPDGSPRANSIYQAAAYTLDELTPYIQRCLEDLPISRAIVTAVPKEPIEDKLTRDEEGKLNSKAVEAKASLREKFDTLT